MTVWYILCSFGTFLSGFGIKYQEKASNPGPKVILPKVLSPKFNELVFWRILPKVSTSISVAAFQFASVERTQTFC
jgi:hypothetical protein